MHTLLLHKILSRKKIKSAVLFWIDEKFMFSILFFIANCLYWITVHSPTRKQPCVLMNDIFTLWSQNFYVKSEPVALKGQKKLQVIFWG